MKNRFKAFSPICIGALGLMLAPDGQAATITTTAVGDGGAFPVAPEVVAATLDQRQFGDDTSSSTAQTFTVDSAFALRSIYLAYENDTRLEADETATLTIFTVADVNATTLAEPPELGDILLTDTVTFPYVGNSDTVAHILLDAPLALAASVGTSGYAIHFSGTNNPGWEWLRTASNGNVYAGGNSYEGGDENISGGGDLRDFTLALSSEVPEPSSLALMTLGGLLIARRRRD